MKDISARELKGHKILAVERFWDNTRWMIEFSVLRPSTAYGSPGDEMRLFLNAKNCAEMKGGSCYSSPYLKQSMNLSLKRFFSWR